MGAQFLAGTGFGSDLFARVRRAVGPGSGPAVGRGAPGDPALYQAVSLLIDYPTAELIGRLPLVRELAEERGESAAPDPAEQADGPVGLPETTDPHDITPEDN